MKRVDDELNDADDEYGPAPDAKQQHEEANANRELKEKRNELVDFDSTSKRLVVVVGEAVADREQAKYDAYNLQCLNVGECCNNKKKTEKICS